MKSKKFLTILTFVVILFGNISNSQSIEPDVFVQSTVNRASEALNSKYSKDEKVQREHHYSIVDEIDSCLIDEARTPLVISGAAEDKTNQYLAIDRLVRKLNKNEHEIDEKDKNILLTYDGINNVEKIFTNAGISKNNNFYDP